MPRYPAAGPLRAPCRGRARSGTPPPADRGRPTGGRRGHAPSNFPPAPARAGGRAHREWRSRHRRRPAERRSSVPGVGVDARPSCRASIGTPPPAVPVRQRARRRARRPTAGRYPLPPWPAPARPYRRHAGAPPPTHASRCADRSAAARSPPLPPGRPASTGSASRLRGHSVRPGGAAAGAGRTSRTAAWPGSWAPPNRAA